MHEFSIMLRQGRSIQNDRSSPGVHLTNHACKIARKKYHRARNTYNLNKNNQTKKSIFFSIQYKLTMNNYIYKYRNVKINKLRTMQTKNPKDYWKYIKSLDKKKDKNYPSLSSLHEHFKNINKSNEPHENYESRY